MSQVLARRYRPQTFEDVIGQGPVIQTLRNAIASGRVAHGFIFSGHRGIGKTTVARILAKALNCQSSQGATTDPCGQCVACTEIRDGNAVDVIEIDAASNRGIDEIRSLRDSVRYRPARDRYKFYILDEAHQLTEDAFNALLKTLEEPPDWAVFVLATTEPEALPATIRSRCQQFSFRAVPFTLIYARLEDICQRENIAAEPEALGLLAEAGEGSLRDALSLLDQAISYSGDGLKADGVRQLLGRVSHRQIAQLLQAIAASDTRAVLENLDLLLGTGVSATQLCRQLVGFVRNCLVAQAAGADSKLLETTDQQREAIAEIARLFSEEDLARFLQILLRTNGDLRFGHEERFHLELGLVKMTQARRLSRVEDLLGALSTGDAGEQKKNFSEPAGALKEPVEGKFAAANPAPAPATAPASPFAARVAAAPPPSPGSEAAAPGAGAKAASSPAGASFLSRAGSSGSETAATKSAREVPPPSFAPQAGASMVVDSKPAAAISVASEMAAAASAAFSEAAGEVAAFTAEVSPSPAAPLPEDPEGRTEQVLQLLEQQKKSSLLSIVDKAVWQWKGNDLCLVFAGESAPLAGLADNDQVRKSLRDACRQVLGHVPEISIERRAEAVAAKPKRQPLAAAELEARAASHPTLQRFKERIPCQVLRTVPYQTDHD